MRGDLIWLKGTKSGGSQRETDLFLEIDDSDVIALFYALIERYQESEEQARTVEVCVEAITRLAAASREIAVEVKTLEAMRTEIRQLTYGSDKTPERRLREIRRITLRKLVGPSTER
jgi:DNA mismatch repair ATPase MutL